MQDRDPESLTEMTRRLDEAAVESGQVAANPVVDEVCDALDGADFETVVGAIMRSALRNLLPMVNEERYRECGQLVKACRDDIVAAYGRTETKDRDIRVVYQRELEYRLADLGGSDAWLWKKTHPDWSHEKVRAAVTQMHQADLARLDWFGAAVRALSARFPWLSEEIFRETLRQIPELAWAHRARITEALKALGERFPEVAEAIVLDNRGGNREVHGCVSGEKLLADYEEMRAEEKAKPPKERLRVKGVGGIYHRLACRYGIRGAKGQPSWREVENRLVRHKKTSGECAYLAVIDGQNGNR
jgi:hypothetical protein